MTRPAYLISHTHWDREWYRTFQQFRLDLVRTVDGVLETLENDPAFAHFLLDGQTIVLDDYLAMRPGNKERLQRQIAAGRLAVGPWYCHPDLFLVSGESIVRNLLLGITMARSYGRCLMVGYIPDQFGHNAQMPQIFQRFGIASAVLWRGVNARETRNESWWEAPDGSRVFLELLSQSYCNAQMLPLDPSAAAARLRQLCAMLAGNATGPGVLLMNGCDHLPVQSGLPRVLAAANELLQGEWEIQQTALDEAVRQLQESGNPTGVLHGELRSPATAHLLPGVLSTRIPTIKVPNARVQQLLEREAEPYAVWAAQLGAPYPLGELWEAWRWLLQNHPHDSICGCSLDQVHREMATRFDWAAQIGEELVGRVLGQIAVRIDRRLAGDTSTHTVPLVVFNPGGAARTERARVTLQLPGMVSGYDLLDADGQSVPHYWSGSEGEPSTVMDVPRESIPPADVMMAQVEGNRVMGMGLQSISTYTDERGLHVEATVGDSGIMTREQIEEQVQRIHHVLADTDPLPVTLHIHRNARHDLHFLARDIPAYGYRTFWLHPVDDTYLGAGNNVVTGADAPVPVLVTTPTIENEFFRVTADAATGALTITDRRSGISYGPCNAFVDGGDAGDSYTYAPPVSDTIVDRPAASPAFTVTSGVLGAQLTIAQEFVVPAGLSGDRASRSGDTVTLPITSTITLTPGCPRIDVETTVENKATDHRLHVTFRVPFAVDHAYAESAFAVVRRPLDPMAIEGAAHEDPVPDAPQQGFVVLHDGSHGLMVTNAGLPEYAAYAGPDGTTTLAITLLRCIGWLSRDDLMTRRGGAGPSIPTPEAQCPGTHTFSYSIMPLDGPWEDALPAAQQAHLPVRVLAVESGEGELPAEAAFLQVDAPGILVAAIKGAEDGQGSIIRLYNSRGETARGTLRLLRPMRHVERLALDERVLDTLYDGAPRSDVPLELGPYKIETLRVSH